MFGAVGLRALPRPGHHHRAHLGDRGACACSSSSRRWASRTSSSGFSGAFFVALIGSLLTAVPLSAGRARRRRARRRRRADVGLRRAADRGDRDRARRPRDQRALDHRPRLDRLLGLAASGGARASSSMGRPRCPALGLSQPRPSGDSNAQRETGRRGVPERRHRLAVRGAIRTGWRGSRIVPMGDRSPMSASARTASHSTGPAASARASRGELRAVPTGDTGAPAVRDHAGIA